MPLEEGYMAIGENIRSRQAQFGESSMGRFAESTTA